MMFRRAGAVLLMLLTACSGVPRATDSSWASEQEREVGPGAARYRVHVVSPGTVSVAPVEVDEDDFTEAVTRLTREARPGARPHEAARSLFVASREAGARATVEDGRIFRMAPVNVSAGAARSEAELTREYLRWCYTQAAVQAEAQGGLRLAAVAEVETVAASSEGTFSVLMKSPGQQAGAVATEAEVAATTLIRHQGGNRQVVLNDQRWHVPANKPLKDIPSADPVGDQLQAAALRTAQRWRAQELSVAEQDAIKAAAARGEYWLSQLLERQARGRFVEKELREQFRNLRWHSTGVDAIDPVTGYRYEVLSGTGSNLALHGQRMADSFFRMITF